MPQIVWDKHTRFSERHRIYETAVAVFGIARGQKGYLIQSEITLDICLYANKYLSESKIQLSPLKYLMSFEMPWAIKNMVLETKIFLQQQLELLLI